MYESAKDQFPKIQEEELLLREEMEELENLQKMLKNALYQYNIISQKQQQQY